MDSVAGQQGTDLAAARALMVDGQLRPNAVTDRRLLDAMRSLPRERFVPPAMAGLAYIEDNLRLPGGRVLLRPMSFARLVQLSAPRAGERVAVIASGTGYGAAVLAAMGAEVTAVEDAAELLAVARPALAEFAPRVRLRELPPAGGLDGETGFPLVLIEGVVARVPDAVARLVAPEGRLLALMTQPGGVPAGCVAEWSEGALRARPAFDAVAPVLPGFGESAGFRL
jgi:protein-L-isoaspartate(D-aspartate) O-methyltransferase